MALKLQVVIRETARKLTSQCCWPIGEPKDKGFRFCGREAPLGRSYCHEHHSLAHTTTRLNYREQAA